MSSIPVKSADSKTQAPSLSDLSPGDKPWDKHRSFADRVEGFYAGSEFEGYSSRIHFCSDLLEFGLAPQEDTSLKFKLRAARFCQAQTLPCLPVAQKSHVESKSLSGTAKNRC